jgi:hypothetical protein
MGVRVDSAARWRDVAMSTNHPSSSEISRPDKADLHPQRQDRNDQQQPHAAVPAGADTTDHC